MTFCLASQQRQMVQALMLPAHDRAIAFVADANLLARHPLWQRGLLAYRSNGIELAQRALCAVYPVTAQILGDATFKRLAVRLWRADPPTLGDVAQWGGGLPALIESISELCADEPGIADVARVEWLLHRTGDAPDAARDAASFQVLADRDPQLLTLVLAPATGLVRSTYPVVSMIEHRSTRVHGEAPQAALIWRDGWTPRFRACADGEASFIAALRDHRSLADSLLAAPDLDFNAWLVRAVQQGLLMAVAHR
ncbi:DUF2063 domain-containing protein [Caenimonas sp. SL110]|uniref:DUF2063 domain-containing protein n=1 Tax=Caenimonas sp. SL110 TaxID=1450524 RepID=UPI0006543583|nr:DUF2063 domain-containing protein [Caenimonas sp. SL110]